MTTRWLLGLACLLVPCLTARGADPAGRPNVVLVLADDLGYETLGCYGGSSYKTPVLDKFAATGVRFTHCYVQPLCTPTRVQLMTGQYNVRNYVEFGWMDPRLKTFAHFFKGAGYATGIAGKWQLGTGATLPQAFGFDEACLWHHTRRAGRYRNPGLDLNGKPVNYTNGEYGPDVVGDYALDFITRHKDKPFFLYYPMMLTHGPYDPTPDSEDYGGRGTTRRQRRQQGNGGIDPHFRDMVQYMDKLVGKLVAHLEKLGLRDNTLVLFLGDNGTGKGTRSVLNGQPFVGGKGETTDAGMHVPLIANWPGKAAAGKVCADLVDSTDLLPTVCEAAGVPIPAGWTVDGRSFLPQLRSEPGRPRDWYYCWYAPRGGVFKGEFAATARYKLYRSGAFYDLDADLLEKHPLKVSDLTGGAAAAAKTLQAALDRYKDARPKVLPKPTGVSGDGE
jgi:arylsulfatase A